MLSVREIIVIIGMYNTLLHTLHRHFEELYIHPLYHAITNRYVDPIAILHVDISCVLTSMRMQYAPLWYTPLVCITIST